MRLKDAILLLFALGALALGAAAQTGEAQALPPGAVALPSLVLPPPDSELGEKPEPYAPDEFPLWARELGRFELIAVGSFPIMLFYAGVGSDLWRYVDSDFSTAYAPWPFKNEYSYEPSEAERNARLWTAAGLSLGVATLDFAVRAIRRHGREKPAVDSMGGAD